ncbi:hypothetical protein I6N95_26495 [Vagococcus sp. BWB3-3]|uniref:Uncharacterized protein n=1 Tax=Vagococcus allomyrinae TaxID=2794353 RepID=A0A940SXQ3_9ENTE|nr:hypothetical protein [Vagococcus allomyrinae]MBP1044565.1 hypothetical protein [Vagococcus allomyrinae]
MGNIKKGNEEVEIFFAKEVSRRYGLLGRSTFIPVEEKILQYNLWNLINGNINEVEFIKNTDEFFNSDYLKTEKLKIDEEISSLQEILDNIDITIEHERKVNYLTH